MDSDSSADENESFTTTNVLLGYASNEETEDTISHLGGQPSWLHDTAPSAALARCLICNDLLSLLLQLHADLPDNFPGHSRRLHIFSCRRKTCRRKQGSVRVLRSTLVDPAQAQAEAKAAESEAAKARAEQEQRAKPTEPVKPSLLGNDLFGGSSKPMAAGANPFALGGGGRKAAGGTGNPFSLASSSELASKAPQRTVESAQTTKATTKTDSTDLPTTFAEKARISAPPPSSTTFPPTQAPAPKPHEPWPTTSTATPYPQSYLDADYEALGPDPAPPTQNIQLMEVDDDSGAGAGSSSSTKAKDIVDDAAESAMDKDFQKFADRLYHNPEQVLRYEFAGRPLLYSRTDEVGKKLAVAWSAGSEGKVKTVAKGMRTGMPDCGGCGSGRVFEVQLTPHAIVELEVKEEDVLEGMEWGTVIVGVCGKDCVPAGTGQGEVGYVEEWAGVQWEENRK